MRGIILLGLVVDGGLPHFVAGGVVQRAEDLVDLLKQRGVALAQTHAGALGRKREAAALREGDEAEVGVGGEIAGAFSTLTTMASQEPCCKREIMSGTLPTGLR